MKKHLPTLLAAAALLTALLCLFQLHALRQELQGVQNSVNNNLRQVQSEVQGIRSGVRAELEQAQELLTQSEFRLVEADYEALTAVLHCRVLPREYQVGVTEAVLVTSAGPLPLLWQDGLFEGRMTLPLTEQVQITGIQLSEDGRVRSETLDRHLSGRALFPTLEARWSGSSRSSSRPSAETTTFTMNGTVRAVAEGGAGMPVLAAPALIVAVDGGVVERIALPKLDLTAAAREDGATESAAPVVPVAPPQELTSGDGAFGFSVGYADHYRLELKDKEFIIPCGSRFELYVESVDSVGLIHRVPLKSAEVGEDGQWESDSPADAMLHGTIVYSAQGEQLVTLFP